MINVKEPLGFDSLDIEFDIDENTSVNANIGEPIAPQTQNPRRLLTDCQAPIPNCSASARRLFLTLSHRQISD